MAMGCYRTKGSCLDRAGCLYEPRRALAEAPDPYRGPPPTSHASWGSARRIVARIPLGRSQSFAAVGKFEHAGPFPPKQLDSLPEGPKLTQHAATTARP